MLSLLLRPLRHAVDILRLATLCCLISIVLGPTAAWTHEGHDHDDAGKTAVMASAFPRVTASSEQYEAVGILKGDRLTFYLDRLATNEPVVDASVSVTIGDRQPVTAERGPDGVFTAAFPKPAPAGSVEVVLNVSAPGGDDLLVGALSPAQPAATAPTPSSSSAWVAILPSWIRHPVLLALAIFALGVLCGGFQRNRRLIPAMAMGGGALAALVIFIAVAFSQGDAVPAANTAQTGTLSDAPRRLPDGTAFVAKPTQRLLDIRTVAAESATATPGISLIGRVIGDPDRTSVVQSVQGGRVTALDGGFPRIGQRVRKGDALVQVEPHLPHADRTTISEKLGEIDQLIAVAEARIRRLRPLAERSVVPMSQVTDSETELEGLRRRRETVRAMRVEREVLTAPTDGVIALAKAVQGQVVQGQDLLFQIVDPQALWVEALVYGGVDPASLVAASAAGANNEPMVLEYRGFSPALQQHAAIVHFAIPKPPPNLSVGQPVTVTAGRGESISGFIVPRDALVRSSSGEAIIWLHVDAERFEPRPVRTQAVDATRLTVSAGLNPNERIVVRGADLINQVR